MFLLLSDARARRGKRILTTTSPEDFAREGVGAQVAAWEDGMRTDGGRGTIEWWYFDARFDDGTTVVVNFLDKPIMRRAGPVRPLLELTITEPDGTTHQSFRIHEPQDFSSASDRCDVRIHQSWARGDLNTYELHVHQDDLAIDLRFTRTAPSWRPGAGVVHFDATRDKHMGWLVAIPHGKVTGTLTVSGVTRAVTGRGYHDHNWANTAINRSFSHWYWGRGHVKDLTLLFVDAYGGGAWRDEHLSLVYVVDRSGVLFDGGRHLQTEVLAEARDESGQSYPSHLRFSAREGDSNVAFEITEPELRERDDLLSVVPQPLRAGLRLFTNPWYFRFESQLTLSVASQRLGHRTAQGTAIYEYMKFR